MVEACSSVCDYVDKFMQDFLVFVDHDSLLELLVLGDQFTWARGGIMPFMIALMGFCLN